MGGQAIFQGIQENSSLYIFDFSHNNIGFRNTKGLVHEIVTLLHNRVNNIIHLDLSYNNFNCKDSKVIGEALHTNHRIIGYANVCVIVVSTSRATQATSTSSGSCGS